MTKTQKLAGAALAGLFTISIAAANPAFAVVQGESGSASNDNAKMEKSHTMNADEKEKHACKGMNSCKGNGADGKNDCKGKGSCATDGSKPK